jgi:hypothetical protein
VLTALTAVAVVAAPWIFRLFSIEVAEGVTPTSTGPRHRARSDLPRPDLLLRAERPRERAAAGAPRFFAARGRRCCPTW